MVSWRWLGSALLVVLPGCAGEASHDEDAPVVQLSAAAQPIYDLMQWQGIAVPASCADAAALSGVDPAADPMAIEAAVTTLAGDVLEGFEFDPLEGRLNVETIERDIAPGPDLTDEQALRDGVTAVVAAMGGMDDQLELEVSGNAAAKNVSIQRLVLELPVGDHGHASFEMDGPLINMFCTWRRFDYDSSTLCVDGIASDEQVMAALAEMLAADGFAIEPTTVALDVATFYRAMEPVDPTSDTWTLRLVGAAGLIDSRGGTIPAYEYYLDDGISLAP
jgi:hypothetical protein